MRRLGDGVEAAMHCLLVLAGLEKGRVLPGKALAEMHGLSESYLLKHLRALTEAGLIEAVPGPRGGYRLAREPARVTLLDIVEAIDGKEPAFVCREIRRNCPGRSQDPSVWRSECFIRSRMLAAERVWREALRAQTLADLVADGERLIDPDNERITTDFIEKTQR